MVRSLDFLINRNIPHFIGYPLRGEKGKAFLVVAKVITLMKAGTHLTPPLQGF